MPLRSRMSTPLVFLCFSFPFPRSSGPWPKRAGGAEWPFYDEGPLDCFDLPHHLPPIFHRLLCHISPKLSPSTLPSIPRSFTIYSAIYSTIHPSIFHNLPPIFHQLAQISHHLPPIYCAIYPYILCQLLPISLVILLDLSRHLTQSLLPSCSIFPAILLNLSYHLAQSLMSSCRHLLAIWVAIYSAISAAI